MLCGGLGRFSSAERTTNISSNDRSILNDGEIIIVGQKKSQVCMSKEL